MVNANKILNKAHFVFVFLTQCRTSWPKQSFRIKYLYSIRSIIFPEGNINGTYNSLFSPVKIVKDKINTQKVPFREPISTFRNHYQSSHHATQTKGKHLNEESNIFFSKFSRAVREVTLSTSQQRGNSVYLPSLRGS